MLKDIYSPLEIDDQWDQRAPVHEDKVEGGNADAMSTATPEVPPENPSGGVAVMDRPEVEPTQPLIQQEPTQVSDGSQAQEAPAMDGEVPGMQTPDMVQPPAVPTDTASEQTTMEEPATEQATAADEMITAEPTGTETPDQDSDDDAASMLGSTDHDVPASPFGALDEQHADAPETTEVRDASETDSAMPIVSAEPETTITPDVQAMVDRPLDEATASDSEQLPVAVSEKADTEALDDDKKTRALEVLNGSIEAIDRERARLEDKLKDYQAKLAEVENNIDKTQEEIDALNAEKDDFLASVAALNAKNPQPSDSDSSSEEYTHTT